MSERFAFLAEPKLAALLQMLNPAGEETRVVGGAVRAALMGMQPADIDLATTFLPGPLMALAQAAHIRAVPTGIDHGTVTLIVGDATFEVTTLREDIATDGRHAQVRFGRSFVADAMRRDFTMNALSISPDGRLHDYVGGQADIAARRVRFIGEAVQRIAEDYLRSMRFFRFHAAYGSGPPDPQALRAIISARAGLLHLSRERVRAEMLKLLATKGAAAAAQDMSDGGLLLLLLGGVTSPARLARARAAHDPLLALAALAVWTAEDAARVCERLRLSKQEHGRLADMAQVRAGWHAAAQLPGSDDLHRLTLIHGRRATMDGLKLAEIDGAGGDWRSVQAKMSSMMPLRLPFSGADLAQRGVASGPAMGAMLKALQASWIRAGFPKDPARLAQLLEEVVGGKA